MKIDLLKISTMARKAAKEGDEEILDLRQQVARTLNNYGASANSQLVNAIVGLIEKHEVDEIPGHEEPPAHLEGLLQEEYDKLHGQSNGDVDDTDEDEKNEG